MTKQFEAGKYAIIGKAAMPFCPLCQMRHTVLIVEHIVPVVDLRFIEKKKRLDNCSVSFVFSYAQILSKTL